MCKMLSLGRTVPCCPYGLACTALRRSVPHLEGEVFDVNRHVSQKVNLVQDNTDLKRFPKLLKRLSELLALVTSLSPLFSAGLHV